MLFIKLAIAILYYVLNYRAILERNYHYSGILYNV